MAPWARRAMPSRLSRSSRQFSPQSAFSNVSCVSNEAAFQEAEELKDLIREADAERETLHDQLKQMKHGCLGRKESVTVSRAMNATLPLCARSYNFHLPEGVDEMLGTVTELTQKLDAALGLARLSLQLWQLSFRRKRVESCRCFRPAWTCSQPATTTIM